MSNAPESSPQPEQQPGGPTEPTVEPGFPRAGAAHPDGDLGSADSQRESTRPAAPSIQPAPPAPTITASRGDVRVRRAPKYPVFIFGGIILGIIATFVAVSVTPSSSDTFLQAFGYFVLYGITFGALIGAIVAVILDAIASRRARSFESERTTVEQPAPDDGPDGVVEGELEN